MKSGSHLLRHVWGIEHLPSMKPSSGAARLDAPDWEELPFIISHMPWSQDLDDMMREQGREIWVLTRDPRDAIVSMTYWMKGHKKDPKSFEWCLNRIAKQARGIVGWEERAEIFRFEELITDPKSVAWRMSEIMGDDYEEILERLLYRGGLTYRPEGGIGTHIDEFPPGLKILYENECDTVRHWEIG